MSHQAPQRSGLGILAGTFLPAIVGGLIVIPMALSGWVRPEGLEKELLELLVDDSWPLFVSNCWMMTCGFVAGVLPLVISGFVLAWHGGALSVSDDAAPTAPVWGLIVGALCGASMVPTLGLMCGAAVGTIVPAVIFGLYAGPICGIVSWEISFFAPRILAARR